MADSVVSDIISSVAGGAVSAADPVSAVAKLGDDIINAIWPSPEAKATAEAQAAQAQIDAYVKKAQVDMEPMLEQIKADAAEAASPSIFVAGWRPFIGWVCGTAFAYAFIVQPIGTFLAKLAGWAGTAPTLDLSTMMPVLLGMLGLGTLRTVEKVQAGQSANNEGAPQPATSKGVLSFLKKKAA